MSILNILELWHQDSNFLENPNYFLEKPSGALSFCGRHSLIPF